METSRLTRDGTAEPVSRDQILRHARGQGNIHFPCSADHGQDWQPYPVDPYSAIYVMTMHIYIHIYIGCKYRTTTYMVFGVKAKSLQIRNAVCTTTYMVFGVKAKSLEIRNAVCISGVFSWFL